MNLPNLLTLSRLGLAALMMVLLTLAFPFSKSMALLVFAIAGLTDYFDGYIARKYKMITPFGQLMDPLTDKVMVCAAFVSFVEISLAHPGTFLHGGVNVGGVKLVPLVPAWITVVIIAREFLVTGLRLLAVNKGVVISAGKWGKHKTVWQIVAIVVLLIGLSFRDDYLRRVGGKALENFDFIFLYAAHAVSVAVAAITVASGYLYFSQHRELISRR
ncbi:MAG TPA: CDP-alcohol phosphatidyltransferase family protein [Kiritimatiellia bacterium]|nr:CDP-alcohol phosphatidyltransferase family protein [Kiritimatiellia bacterium]HMO99656.1 CDP-alcohol phosphatidyltransferase family protein [Kiritimatiellia bacterium]HMP96170.1 CDP-alcohol phosphatidyltransferase family protein [Kiritimatiellia bacterium]